MFKLVKIFNEGTNSPFVRRLHADILEYRDAVLPQIDHKMFDELYMKVFHSLRDCRECVFKAHLLLDDYASKVNNGQIIGASSQVFTVNESIDAELSSIFNNFVNSGHRAYKNVQNLTRPFGLDIGPLYQREQLFDNYIIQLKSSGMMALADYLQQIRGAWCDDFNRLRNRIEHEDWQLGEIDFLLDENSIIAVLPQVYNENVFEYMKRIVCELSSFLENLVIYVFQMISKSISSEIDNKPWEIKYCKIYDELWLLKG